ncbi:MAG: FliA/WhiG family RNA polymerase sigma factor [Clostridia bacterium]|nr:FliA/WhiG family RNA polymerase sigma factor [Clostridia bacterium]MCI1999874.1 FliA/WhiG family RNA polymerase sigma factor [Clostridia bacterium]MCI2014210.1 FliA/WhiG family RNA polymerase sigma factor [Clostridia bacterium]
MKLKEKLCDMTSEELFIEYKTTHNLKVRNELVLRYIHIVKNIAIQMRGVYNDLTQIDDIVNEGVIVLMNAIDKFDINKNIKFESFISKRIRGLVIDIARKNDWVPRSIRKAAKSVDKAANDLFIKFGRMPTDDEMADYMNMPIEKYRKVLGDTNLMNVLSFEILLDGAENGLPGNQVMSSNLESMPEHYLDTEELKMEMRAGFNNLRDKEKLVISLHYVQGLNMKEIAGVLGVSEPRISQLHSNALRKLRIYLQGRI